MNETLIHFIWQFRYFNQQALHTLQGEPLKIIATGEHNTHQGPDFSNARIMIGNTTWAGNVELHVLSSHWKQHGHQHDPNFSKVILHVVWRNDEPVDANGIPVLELENRVPAMMLDQYQRWMQSKDLIPCHAKGTQVHDLVWLSWKDRLLHERMQQKTKRISQHLAQTNQHWEEVCWRMVARYFGGSTNAESFEQVANSLPITILARHKNQIHQLEALLLGQAGLLHKNFTEHYPVMLYKEYQFLQKKYGLRVINKPPSFLRMRPVNFPTIRLAQLAMLVHQSQHLFAEVCEAEKLDQVIRLFDVTANDYWSTHYRPDEESELLPKHLGRQAIDTIIINAICPLLFAWGKINGQDVQVRKAMNWLQQLPAESNSIVKAFDTLEVSTKNAYDSQALIELKKEYCDTRRCLECAVGNALLKQNLQQAQPQV